ncbi:MAG: hypothetical protein Q8M19_01005 [Reyranella sp.]|nr:hypothetical protein [Reyranella sp.]
MPHRIIIGGEDDGTIVGQMISGSHEQWFQHFAIDRPTPKT